MRQIRPALLGVLCCVLVLAPVSAVGATAAPAVSVAHADSPSAQTTTVQVIRSQENTTNFLDIRETDVQRGEHGESSLDVSGALAADVEHRRGTYAKEAFDAGYTQRTDPSRRIDRLRAEVNRLELQIEALERRQATAIDAYNRERVTTEQFVRELVAIDVAAGEVSRQFDHLDRSASLTMPSDLEERIANAEADLVPLQGVVREHARSSMTGERPAARVYALTSPDGVVLSSTDGQRFYREAYLPSNRDKSGTDNFITGDDPTGLNPANDRARELYPWSYDNASPSLSRKGTTSVYSVGLDHTQGVLQTFLDGATRNVFREIQVLQLDALPTSSSHNVTTELALRVNRTYGTGPMKVTTTDPDTGLALDAIVVVNGERVGRTGPDGRLWTVTPTQSAHVEVRAGNATAELTFLSG